MESEQPEDHCVIRYTKQGVKGKVLFTGCFPRTWVNSVERKVYWPTEGKECTPVTSGYWTEYNILNFVLKQCTKAVGLSLVGQLPSDAEFPSSVDEEDEDSDATVVDGELMLVLVTSPSIAKPSHACFLALFQKRAVNCNFKPPFRSFKA